MTHDPAWESQIAPFRRNRQLLVARNINFKVTRAQFEAGVQAKLTKPDSVTFLWPPSPARYSNPIRHQGWVMLKFSSRADVNTAERSREQEASASIITNTAPTTAPTTVAPAAVTPAAVTPAAVTPAVVTPAVVTPAAVTPAAVTPAAIAVDPPAQSTSAHGTATGALAWPSHDADTTNDDQQNEEYEINYFSDD
ncbi:hypothetical protein MGU_04278 [Metarhizium guizhouense ARSEF 977]|uniref:Uncharacterized protein n=1 Tax=Metarhizium guizhouense (strain ARSEF 977) TaxID=1276136 RepID=A0A0B4GNX4_METGA|nr:hypothetical protein MGU_04278 [Metarhizium guizhouense ARSEF 977]